MGLKFYNRETELQNLKQIEKLSEKSSKMTIIIGRRRVGKTTLVKEAYEKSLYFFVAKKSEALLCEEFINIIENFGIKVFGEFRSFAKLFEYLLEISKTKRFTLIIDEFQEFLNINPSIFSDIQNLWDSYKNETKVNLVLSGSIYSLMKKIFENRKEPLFGRADNKIDLKPFNVSVQKEIIEDNFKNFTNEDVLNFYILSGGVAKYIEYYVENKALKLNDILDLILNGNSLLIDEGKNILIEEFGKEYAVYFSILTLISSSKTSRKEMESILGKNIGGYLERLEKDYSIIKKIKPVFSKPNTKNVKYEIEDNFLNFWFRFIYKNRSAVELENYEYIKEIILRDFKTFGGKFLERYFKEKLKETKKFSQIGSFWDRKNENEIDIVAINELEKKALIAEVKLNKNKINLNILKEKAKAVIPNLKGYTVEYKGFSLEDV
jgi:hypothetical protein